MLNFCVRFDIPTPMLMKIYVFLEVALCWLPYSYHCLEDCSTFIVVKPSMDCLLGLLGPQMLVTIYQSTWR